MEKKIYEEIVKEDDVRLLNPVEYFQTIKDRINEMDNKKLEEVYRNALKLAAKYHRTGQTKGLRKLTFHIDSILKEKKVIDAGITKFVFKDDIEEYIQDVASKQVVIIDIANYERMIPDEIVEKMLKVKNLFDEFYVVTTDYQGTMSKQVQKERREKDPILFGAFLNREKQAINERFYYIGDWIDDYCDLTLDKMVSEMKNFKGEDIVNTISIPSNQEELQGQLDMLKITETTLENKNEIKVSLISNGEAPKKKKGFFRR